MKRRVFYLVSILILCIIFAACDVVEENKDYSREIINDGAYIEIETGNEKLKQYAYPALEELLESIEDSERKELVSEILSMPTSLEFSVKKSISKDTRDLKEMYKDTFSMAEKLINLPISELREKAKDAQKSFEKLKIEAEAEKAGTVQ